MKDGKNESKKERKKEGKKERKKEKRIIFEQFNNSWSHDSIQTFGR